VSETGVEKSSGGSGGAAGQPAAAPSGAALAIVAAVALALLGSGLGFRFIGQAPRPPEPTPLRRSLDEFPREFLGYGWRNQPLEPEIEKVAGASAYLNLLGFRSRDAAYAHLYVSYYNQAQTLVEHEPQVCMVEAGGWSLPYGILRNEVKIPAPAGDPAVTLPVNVYLFRKDVENLLMVNYYCVNSEYFNSRDEVRMKGLIGRGFYAQTRVSIPLSDLDAASINETTYADSEPYKRAVEVLQFVVPELEKYLPFERRTGDKPQG